MFPGIELKADGAIFTVRSKHATRIDVCLFDSNGEAETLRVPLQAQGDLHSAFIPDVKVGQRYGLRADGPFDLQRDHRFDSSKLLVDPHATELDRPYTYHPDLGIRGHETAHLMPKAIVRAPWPKVQRPAPHSPKWIYELNVKAFSQRHPGIPENIRGTIAALAHPASLAHFKKLNVDTIELMPILAWIDERHLHALGLSNAWGYNTVTFFAPDPRLAPGGFSEIAETIQTLHSHGFQIILDVALNHTGEGHTHGPTLSFRGLDNSTYYAHAQAQLINDSGCGNTVALNEPSVASYALAALRHWIEATGADGFRFDLATILGRDLSGFRADSRLLRSIEHDPVLSQCILIAEPWDVGPGGYQLGKFSNAYAEWNDRFRDDVRRFWRGDSHSANGLATRLTGSSDVFGSKSPRHGVNFISAHDGFTLRDVVTYSTKNNYNNGEGNRDGKNEEVTWPGGRVRALLATLFLSQGIPMLTAGDEMGRTQNGNNNAYAQDNDVTWLHWADADQELITFTATLAKLRSEEPFLSRPIFLTGKGKPFADAEWFDLAGTTPDWHRPDNRFLGLILSEGSKRIAIVCNGSAASAQLPLNPRKQYQWQRVFCSREETHCPAHSVSLFREVLV